MEQSRLAATATRFYRALSLARQNQANSRRRFAAVSSGRPADPAVFSEERDREVQPAVPTGKPEEMKEKYEPETATRKTESNSETEADFRRVSSTKGSEPLTPPKPPYSSSYRLESTGVNNLFEPQIQQKRENSTSSLILEETSCAGLDGTPWPKENEQEDDEKEYYKHHKASPLSEIEIADTRKPITRATDGGAGDSGMGREVVGWLPEQLDTAEEALLRASRIWRENAMRGDPDSPHGRVLRTLRGEWF
ncbi:uncharacterized protein LOC126653651 [Mercurialis annua]|uniref:uncharacterized protein LOC126653651 n=1 Tax=Mercurialis annua TaxID=3986 RepID=UPI00215E8771|nr:uncharacterized protein LOC126653651 [Mercurialis annua]